MFLIVNGVGTDGGPLLLIPGRHLLEWEGSDPPTGGRVVQATFRCADPDMPATDYDLACDVREYLGVIPVGAGTALVLGGEPLPAWWAARPDGGILVRWIYGDDTLSTRDATRTVVEDIPEALWQPEEFDFTVPEGLLYLMDSAYPGRELSSMPEDSQMSFSLRPGTYSVETADYEPSAQQSLVLHRLTLVRPPSQDR